MTSRLLRWSHAVPGAGNEREQDEFSHVLLVERALSVYQLTNHQVGFFFLPQTMALTPSFAAQ